MAIDRISGRSHTTDVTELLASTDIVRRMVAEALRVESVWHFSQVLGHVAKSIEAAACILWELAPPFNLDARPPDGRLVVLTQWFAEDTYDITQHEVPLSGSVAGAAIIDGRSLLVPDIWITPLAYVALPFLKDAHIRSQCVVPVDLADGAKAALALYRTEGTRPFTLNDVVRAEQFVALIPALYQSIRDRINFRVVAAIAGMLGEADDDVAGPPSSKRVDEILQHVIKLLDQVLQCGQLAVYLEDPHEAPGVFNRIAATADLTDPSDTEPYLRNDERLGSWVLTHGRSLNLFDVANEDLMARTIEREYPGLSWAGARHLSDAVQRHRASRMEHELPLLSFMAAPVLSGSNILGIMHCIAARRSPYHFTDRDRVLLELVAAQVGQYWRRWLTERSQREENRAWKGFVAAISQLNQIANQEVLRDQPDLRKIYGEALRAARELIRGADSVNVRFLDTKSNELYYFETGAESWPVDQPVAVELFKQRRWPLSSDFTPSAGARVAKTRKTAMICDVTADAYCSPTFDGITRMIIAPIASSDQLFGVLDIRSTHRAGWPRYAGPVAELLGQQLGLYHHFMNTRERLNAASQDQRRTIFDLKHQLSGPVHQAQRRLEDLLRSAEYKGESVHRSLLEVRGIFRKVRSVVASMDLFTAMAKGADVTVTLVPGLDDYLIKLLVEAARDSEMLIESYRGIKVIVDRASFRALPLADVWADRPLLEQAVNCLVDNAVKYSYANTTVRIRGAMAEDGKIQIIVRNVGLPVLRDEVARCVEYGWRGHAAQLVTGEGSGIGLWIVDHIMRAHGGRLVVCPTTMESVTEVLLELPIRGA
jgi:signal transduction histidine kinase